MFWRILDSTFYTLTSVGRRKAFQQIFHNLSRESWPKLAEKVISQPLGDPLRYLGNEINNARFKLETVSVGYVERQ